MAQVCMEVPETECELVGYTECDSDKTSMPARDDKVFLLILIIIIVILILIVIIIIIVVVVVTFLACSDAHQPLFAGGGRVLLRAGLLHAAHHRDRDEDAAGVRRPEEELV